MLIKHPKPFRLGAMLAITFAGVFLLILSPIFGDGMNGLQFSDNMFNKLSKGSSHFIPRIAEQARRFEGETLSLTIKMDNPEHLQKAPPMLMAAGLLVGVEGSELSLSGDLGRMLSRVLQDSDEMFHNQSAKVRERYGFDAMEAMALWWNVLNKIDKELKKQKKVDQSNMVSTVIKKGIEPAYNFYGIEAQRVADKAVIMTALLIFYVIYTMWWGYAIFYLFEGMGLSMKKSKVKKEV